MKSAFAALFAFVAISASALACPKPYIYFDLGETLVDTSTYNFEKIYYIQGAHEYLADLRDKGYPIGLIVNIPEEWGTTEEAKIKELKSFLAASWKESLPFDWEAFNLGILIPPTNKERKPAPYLFEKAFRAASAAGCPSLYVGEDRDELAAAVKAGMKSYRVGQGPSFYLPENEIEDYVRSRE